jgi:hypothetical protein
VNGPPVSWLVVEKGWTVVAADGGEVGTVDKVVGDENLDIFDGLAVSTGRRHTVYVPAERVGTITAGQVRLAINADEAERLEPYTEPPPSEEILPESASLMQRIAGWFRGGPQR